MIVINRTDFNQRLNSQADQHRHEGTSGRKALPVWLFASQHCSGVKLGRRREPVTFSALSPPSDLPKYGWKRHRSGSMNHDWQNWQEAAGCLGGPAKAWHIDLYVNQRAATDQPTAHRAGTGEALSKTSGSTISQSPIAAVIGWSKHDTWNPMNSVKKKRVGLPSLKAIRSKSRSWRCRSRRSDSESPDRRGWLRHQSGSGYPGSVQAVQLCLDMSNELLGTTTNETPISW